MDRTIRVLKSANADIVQLRRLFEALSLHSMHSDQNEPLARFAAGTTLGFTQSSWVQSGLKHKTQMNSRFATIHLGLIGCGGRI